MTFHRERHAVLAGNLANLDTPKYEPRDLVRAAPGEASGGLSLTRTSDSHLAPEGEGARATELVRDETAVSHQPDGNGVSLDRELAKVEANRLRYQVVSTLVSRSLAGLRYAAGGGT